MEIHRGLTFDEYHTIDALNWSKLKHILVSPLHFKHALETPDVDTPRLGLGRAVHTAILEPDAFMLRYVMWKGARRAGKEWDAFAEANADKTILRADEYADCLAMRDAVRANEIANGLLYGESELVVTWTDDATGLECKARLDHINADHEIVDLKTTNTIEAFAFERTSHKMFYHAQLAFYRRPFANALRPRIIAVEVNAPHDVGVFHLTDDAMFAGDQRVDEALRRVAFCRETGKYPGRYNAEQDLSVPSWELDENDIGFGITVEGSAV